MLYHMQDNGCDCDDACCGRIVETIETTITIETTETIEIVTTEPYRYEGWQGEVQRDPAQSF